jgi:hypothetical protein
MYEEAKKYKSRLTAVGWRVLPLQEFGNNLKGMRYLVLIKGFDLGL